MSAWGKLFLLLGLIILSSLFSAFAGLLIGKLIFSVDLDTLAEYLANPESPEAIVFMKFYQFINQLGLFIVPVIFFSFLVSLNVTEYLHLNKVPRLLSILISGLIVYTVLPFNHFILEINQTLNLPETFAGVEKWMIRYEEQAKMITESILKTSSSKILIVNLIIVALLPAIGEEWLFRGVLLKLFKQITGNYHWAIFITAFLFAALHLQFLSFLPRFMLGILLGYMFVLTRNLWIPIVAHFVNNASSVIIFYLHHNGQINVSLDEFGSSVNTIYIIGSLLITVWLMFILFGRERASLKA